MGAPHFCGHYFSHFGGHWKMSVHLTTLFPRELGFAYLRGLYFDFS